MDFPAVSEEGRVVKGWISDSRSGLLPFGVHLAPFLKLLICRAVFDVKERLQAQGSGETRSGEPKLSRSRGRR
jgi:hypothetical protein